VTKCSINATNFTVVIPATGKYDSRFGTCNCGKPSKEGILCENMVAVVKLSCIDGLYRIQMMPYCWTNAHWRAQYAVNVECRVDIVISTTKDKYTPDKTLCYCPAWMAGKKVRVINPSAVVPRETVRKGIVDASAKGVYVCVSVCLTSSRRGLP
jgi:hypothetical protein